MHGHGHLKHLTKKLHGFSYGREFRVVVFPKERHYYQLHVRILRIIEDIKDGAAVVSRVRREGREEAPNFALERMHGLEYAFDHDWGAVLGPDSVHDSFNLYWFIRATTAQEVSELTNKVTPSSTSQRDFLDACQEGTQPGLYLGRNWYPALLRNS